MNETTRIYLKSREETEVSQGFPWVYDNEIANVKWLSQDGSGVKTTPLSECQVKDGSLVEVYANAGGFLGTAVINKKSKITLRLIGREHADKILSEKSLYISHLVHEAVNIRGLHFSQEDSCRLIYGEADGLPGLIVERYVSEGKVYLVVQFLALACEVFREEIIAALKESCHPYGIYERSDEKVHEKEGLPLSSGWIGTARDTKIIIKENGVLLEVDIKNGQKTGYFLDQKWNRKRVAELCHGKRVLDTFTHTGAFGLNAFMGGAKEVISVDISDEAVAQTKRNISLNGADKKVTALQKDVFDLLKEYEEKGEMFDVIILDPPAFTKSAKQIQKAYGGYKEINLRAMRLLREGGILVTCSCSYYFDENNFYSMLMHAAKDSHKKVQVLEKRGAAPDHPVLIGYPQSEYLKCAICRVS